MSIIMPVYRKAATLLAAIHSVEEQTLRDWELIVWDDGSPDVETAALLATITSAHIRVFRDANQGVVGARNAAIRESVGSYLACLDPDDEIAPTYLEKAVLRLETDPLVDIVYPWVQTSGALHEVWRTVPLDPRLMAQANHIPVCAVFRRAIFDATGGFSQHFSDGCEDWGFWAHAASLGFRGASLSEPLFRYHYSDVDGRDAAARKSLPDFRRRISQLYPNLSTEELPDHPRSRQSGWDHTARCVNVPAGDKSPIVLCLAWFLTTGGGDAVARDLATAFVADGRTVVTFGFSPGPVGAAPGHERMLQITPYVYDVHELARDGDIAGVVLPILRQLKDATIIVIGARWAYKHLDELRSAVPGRCAVVDYLFNHTGHLALNVDSADLVDVTVTASDRLRRLLTDYYQRSGLIRTIYVGITPSAPPSESRLARRRPRFVWLGRQSAEKRPEWFIAAALELGAYADFVMTGDGPLGTLARTQAAEIAALSYLGEVDDPMSVVADADALIITSEVEGIPLTAMEAVSLGVPVISTTVGGIAEFIADGQNGRLVDPTSPDDLIRVLAELIESPETLRQLQRTTSNEGLAARFTRSSMVDAWVDLVGSIRKGQ